MSKHKHPDCEYSHFIKGNTFFIPYIQIIIMCECKPQGWMDPKKKKKNWKVP
jgi:hypothetical protein